MLSITTPKKLAFVHIPRTAGVFTLNYLRSLGEYTVYNSYDIKDDEWTEEELLDLARKPEPSLVHNHSYGWTKRAFREFKNNNWFVFSFIRDPREQICSFYYYMLQNYPERLLGASSLDEFCHKMGYYKNCLPEFWRELNYFDIFTTRNFAGFLKTHLRKRYRPKRRENASASKGFSFYYEEGLISEESKNIIESSDFFEAYQFIKARQT